jgi:two-component system, OmpR family, phosphate regulon response regulator PhoB
MAPILIASAARDAAEVLRNALSDAGHETIAVGSLSEAIEALRAQRVKLAIADLEIPGPGGVDLCREIRALPGTIDVPIVAIASERGEADRVAVLELGVDDAVTRPLSVREVVLRVHAVLRRSRRMGAELAEPSLVVGGVTCDACAHRVFVNGVEVHLTLLEVRLLARLMANVGRVQSRKELLVDVWTASPAMRTRTIDTHVRRLRAKLGASGELLETVRGIGYRLVAPVDEDANVVGGRAGPERRPSGSSAAVPRCVPRSSTAADDASGATIP